MRLADVLNGDPRQELPLADRWSAADGTESAARVVEGSMLSKLLSAFDPPLPTDVKKPLLLGVGGFKESGKDALASHLAGVHGFHRMGMSTPLVEVGRRQNPWILLDRNVAHGSGEKAAVEFRGTFVRLNDLTEWLGYDESKTIREVREYYKTLGTEVGRGIFGEDVWADMARETINRVRDAGQPVVITGIRFRNELDMIKRLGGHSVWVERPGKVSDGHASESSLSKEDFDSMVDNDRDLDTLYRRGSSLLNHLG